MTDESIQTAPAAFVARLESLGVVLEVAGDRLRLSAPKDVLTPELRDELQRRKADIVAFLTARPRLDGPLIVAPIDRTGPVELGVAQERIWFLHQIDPMSSAYHVGGAVRLTGRFVVEAFERAWTELARRHEALRTLFVITDGRPTMRIVPPTPVALEHIDVSHLSRSEAETAMVAHALGFMARPFDIEHGPVWRLSVVRIDEREHVLVLSMHHLIADYGSMMVLSAEFCELYAGYAAHETPHLPPLRVQFADFAAAHRAWLDGPRAQKQLDYWRERLAGLDVAELPTDRPRTAETTPVGEYFRVPLAPSLINHLRELGAAERATLYMVMVAAFDVVLSIYTGSTDVTLGTPVSNRPSADVDRVVGMFVNTLVFRTDLSGNPTFRELVQRVRDMAIDAYANQDVSFDRLVSTLRPDRSRQTPFFQVLFNMLSGRADVIRLADLEFAAVRLPAYSSQFDLNVTIESDHPDPAQNAITFAFDRQLFEPLTMTRLARHYLRVLQLVVETPDLHINAVSLLDDEERRQLLVEWNATDMPLPAEVTVVSLFEAQAAATPDAVAVVCGLESVTYAELDERATRIAAALQALDLGAERIVGICLHRSIEMVAALLAVLKAGAAYLPLDPAFPADRLGFMIEDSTTAVIVSELALRPLVSAGRARVMCLDDHDDPVGEALRPQVRSRPAPTDRAYILYTSGSTGRPKGVEIGHRAFANFLLSMAREPGMTSGDRLLAVTTLSFDIAGLELCLPLITGARVVVATRDQAMDPVRLEQLLKEHEITFMQATPATWRLLIENGWPGRRDLVALCGGEPMPRALANQLIARAGAVWNMYGPTETTVWSTLDRVTADDEAITIGCPIANTQVYVLDALGRPTPVGVPGELFIGGEGLARGYFNRPDLTASRFVRDPFSTRPGARMYRTGDLARFRPDGRLECLGRLDTQVKVRGFRIELGEIEAILATHPGVKQVVVVVRQDHGEAVLAGYVVASGQPVAADALREHARQHLPAYMVPTFFIDLPSLPLTPNGKVDRKALPAPAVVTTTPSTQPSNEIERAVAEIWSQVLNIPDVPLEGNFFDLGGHSLLLAQVQRQLDERLKRQVSMLDLLQYPTVRSLAARFEPETPDQQTDSRVRDRMERQRDALTRQRPRRAHPIRTR